MSFGGHVAKAAAEAKAAVEAEENEEIERAVEGISLSDDDDGRGSDMSLEQQAIEIVSIASSANSMEVADLRTELIKLKTENYLAKMALEKANINKVNAKQVMHDDIVKTTADQALHRKNRTFRIGNSLPLGWLTDQPLAILGERND